jgi:hypothetical protein
MRLIDVTVPEYYQTIQRLDGVIGFLLGLLETI